MTSGVALIVISGRRDDKTTVADAVTALPAASNDAAVITFLPSLRPEILACQVVAVGYETLPTIAVAQDTVTDVPASLVPLINWLDRQVGL
jgi:hypothetical protein